MVDVRAKIISHHLSGSSPTEILKKLSTDNVNRMLVYRTIKRYRDTGSVNDRHRSGRPTTTRTVRIRKAMRSRITRNPKRSMRKMAIELGTNRESLRKLVHEDLGLKSLKRKTVHHLTPTLRRKRLVRCKGLLRRLAPRDMDKVLLSDEKLFTVEEVNNRQNDRILASTSKDIPEKLNMLIEYKNPCLSWFGEECRRIQGQTWCLSLKV